MANFTQLTNNLNIIQSLSTLPNSQDGLTDAQFKAKFDEASGLIKLYINNTLIAELQAQGGAEKVGAVVGGVASNIQAFINAVESAGTGNLPPAGSVTNTMMATDVKVGSLSSLTTTEKGSLTGALNEVNAKPTPNSILTTEGDMMFRNGTQATRLAKGNAGAVLKMNANANAPEWLSLGSANHNLSVNSAGNNVQWNPSLQSVLNTTGDIVYASANNTPARLAIGSAGLALVSDGSKPVYGFAKQTSYLASDEVIATANTERTHTDASFNPYKQFFVARRGTVRIKFEIKIGTTTTCYYEIRKADNTVLASGNTTSSSYTLKSHDITINSSFETLSIYIRSNSNGTSCSIRNASLCGTVQASDSYTVSD